MPFDGNQTDYAKPALETDEVGQLILKARELLSDPAMWFKGDFECQETGAVCVAGALGFRDYYPILDDEEHSPQGVAEEALYRIEQALPIEFRFVNGERAAYFNDDPATTHADILDLLSRAAALPRAGGE